MRLLQGPHQNQSSHFIKRDGFINKKLLNTFFNFPILFSSIKSSLLPSFPSPVPFGPSFELSILPSVIMQVQDNTQNKEEVSNSVVYWRGFVFFFFFDTGFVFYQNRCKENRPYFKINQNRSLVGYEFLKRLHMTFYTPNNNNNQVSISKF